MTTLYLTFLQREDLRGNSVGTIYSEDEMAKHLMNILDEMKNLHEMVLRSLGLFQNRDFAMLIFPELVKRVRHLHLGIVLTDDLATIFAKALSQHDTATTRHLTNLSFDISTTLSAQAGLELAQGLSNNPQISTLRLDVRNNSFEMGRADCVGAFYHICSLLPYLTSLTRLTVVGNFTSYKRDLPLHSAGVSQAILPTQAEMLMVAFRCLVKQVRSLNLNDFELNDDLATILGQALSQNDTTTRNLTELTITLDESLSTHAGLELAKGLSNNPQISTLHLYCEDDCDTKGLDYGGGFHHLCRSLPNLTSLTTLFIKIDLTSSISDLSLSFPRNVEADDYGGTFYRLCSSLPNLVSLTSLQIYCNLTSYNIEPSLRNPENSQPTHRTPAEALMVAITNHPTLSHLDLSWTYDCGLYGLRTIVRQLANQNVKIRKIDLGHGWVDIKFPDKNASTKDKEAMAQLELDSIGEDLAESLKSNFHICELKIDEMILIADWDENSIRGQKPVTDVSITKMIKDRIGFFIDLNKKGRRLLRHPNFSDVPPSLWCIILAGCGNVASLVYGLLRETTPNGNLLLVEIVGTERNRKRKISETMC